MVKVRKEVFKHKPKIETWKKILLALPILLSLSCIFYLQYNQQVSAYYGMELLSPANTAPLMIALIIFTIGYVLFLVLMFSENIQEVIWRFLRH